MAPVGIKEAGMLWIVAVAMAAVGGFWVKVRRDRKAKATNTFSR
jgi:hypothetical protein